MRKLFMTALLVAMMSASTVFAADTFSATSLKLGAAESQSFVYQSNGMATATATLVDDLEARPVSMFVQRAKKFKSDIQLKVGERSVNAKSIVAIMDLRLKAGTEVEIIAKGPDAQEAVDTLKAFIEAGFGQY